MMRKYEFIKRLLTIAFITMMVFLFSVVSVAHAATTPDSYSNADDDITWNSTSGSYSSIQLVNIGTNMDLGYTFGLAQDTSGNVFSMDSDNPLVKTNNDNTVTNDSVVNGTNNLYRSKMNIFLRDNKKYISSVFQSGYATATTNTQNVSLTSPDFLIVPTTMPSSVTTKNYALLANMTNKKIYTGKDKNGHLALKIVGDFKRGTGTGSNDFDLQAEILLRASPSNSADVQRELFLRNNSTRTQNFQFLFGEDTKLGDDDSVFIKDLGTQNGLYIENSQTDSDGVIHNYKLIVTNQTVDGFDQYAGQAYTSGSGMNWASGFDSNGNGAESKDYNYGADITGKGKVDSSYSLKWNKTSLAPGETSHYGSTMGVTSKPYALPVVSKNYTNETTGQTGSKATNHVNDTLKFSLNVQNNGYGSSWTYKTLEDKIPDGLQFVSGSLRLIDNDGTSQKLSDDDYDSSTKTLTIPPALSLSDGQRATIIYEAKIDRDAGSKTITNTATFTGHDTVTSDKSYTASANISVEKPAYDFEFTKQVKNLTNNETDFKDSTDAKVGDTLEYYIHFTVKGTDSLEAGSQLTEKLPAGIEQDGAASVKGPKDTEPYQSNSISTGIAQVDPGETVTIDFKAKVTSAAIGAVDNTVTISGGTTSNGTSIPTMDSTTATANIQKSDGITEVPSLIDFGAVDLGGKSKTLGNIATKGQLIVNHPDSNDFSVNVAYDNDDPNSQMINLASGETMPTDGTNLLFLRQRDDSDTDSGTWQPVSASGTRIRTKDFGGNQDSLNLTNYIGVNDWQIKIPQDTSSGVYQGTLTWSLNESL